jgi:Protein of unknown function (DUF3102)
VAITDITLTDKATASSAPDDNGVPAFLDRKLNGITNSPPVAVAQPAPKAVTPEVVQITAEQKAVKATKRAVKAEKKAAAASGDSKSMPLEGKAALAAIAASCQAPVSINTVLDEHAAAIKALGKQTIDNVIAIGCRLAEAKKIAGPGRWLSWLDREFGWTDRTALNFMRVYGMSTKSEKFSDFSLPISGLYLLAAPTTPDEARDEIFDRAKDGEIIPLAGIKKEIDKHKATAKRLRKPKDWRETKTADGVLYRVISQIEVGLNVVDDCIAIEKLTDRRQDFKQQLHALAARILEFAERIGGAP